VRTARPLGTDVVELERLRCPHAVRSPPSLLFLARRGVARSSRTAAGARGSASAVDGGLTGPRAEPDSITT
jgi:hypothetical protein